MTQYNFGTIDPYVVDGVQLASMLNQWRDAIHSMHRGPTRPTYAVPGTMWLDDSGGATNWRVRVFVGGSFDATLASINTSTGNVTLTAFGLSLTGNMAAQTLALQGTAPEFGMIKTDNGVDLKRWAHGIDAVGRYFIRPLTDGGGGLATLFYFNQDGTLNGAGQRIRGGLSGGFTVNTWVPLTINTSISNDTGAAPAANTWTPPAGRWRIRGTLSVDVGASPINYRIGYGLNSTTVPTAFVNSTGAATSAENVQLDDVVDFNGSTTLAWLAWVSGSSTVSGTGSSFWSAHKIK